MPTPRQTLKQWFSRGKKPTALQFAAWIDSFWHKTEDTIQITDINGLSQTLNQKADVGHTHDASDIHNLPITQVDTAIDPVSTNPVENQAIAVALQNKANTNHSHEISDTNGLQTAFNQKSDNGHHHTAGEIEGLADLLKGKSDTGHTHTASDIDDFQNRVVELIDEFRPQTDPEPDIQEVVYVADAAALEQIAEPSESTLYITDDTGYFYKYRDGEFELIEDNEDDGTIYCNGTFTNLDNLLKQYTRTGSYDVVLIQASNQIATYRFVCSTNGSKISQTLTKDQRDGTSANTRTRTGTIRTVNDEQVITWSGWTVRTPVYQETLDNSLSSTSNNAVKNKVIKTALDGKAGTADLEQLQQRLSALSQQTEQLAAALQQQGIVIGHLEKDEDADTQTFHVDNGVDIDNLPAGSYRGIVVHEGITYSGFLNVMEGPFDGTRYRYQIGFTPFMGRFACMERFSDGSQWTHWWTYLQPALYPSIPGSSFYNDTSEGYTQEELQAAYDEGFAAYSDRLSDNHYDSDSESELYNEYERGYAAAETITIAGQEGYPDEANPYEQDTREYIAWQNGYDEAYNNDPANFESPNPEPEPENAYSDGYNYGYAYGTYSDADCPYYDTSTDTITNQEAYDQWMSGAFDGSEARMMDEQNEQMAAENAYSEGSAAGRSDTNNGDTVNPYSEQNEPNLYSNWQSGYEWGWSDAEQQRQMDINNAQQNAYFSGQYAGENDANYGATTNPYSQDDAYNVYNYWQDGYEFGWQQNQTTPIVENDNG